MADRDRNLVRKSIQGDTGAFAALYQAHGPAVYRLLTRLTANRSDAEDLTQETFLAAYRSLGSWRGDGRLSTWLCGIAIRLYRKSVRRAALVSTEPYDDGCFEMPTGDDPLDALTQRDLADQLDAAILRLPAVYRETFVLIRVEGYTQRACAELLEIPIGTVQSRLWRATCRLRKALAADLLIDTVPLEGDARDRLPNRA